MEQQFSLKYYNDEFLLKQHLELNCTSRLEIWEHNLTENINSLLVNVIDCRIISLQALQKHIAFDMTSCRLKWQRMVSRFPSHDDSEPQGFICHLLINGSYETYFLSTLHYTHRYIFSYVYSSLNVR